MIEVNVIETQSKRPDDGAFYQQRLPAWKPQVNLLSTIPVFGAIGIFLLPIGLVLVITSGAVKEIRLDYSECGGCETAHYTEPCNCSMDFNLESKYGGNSVMMYYGLERFYQNHRKYATSRSDYQLKGYPMKPSDNCEPFEADIEKGKVYAPCGLIANSMFNDTFSLQWISKIDKDGTVTDKNLKINATTEGIAWSTDHGIKFQNPAGEDIKAAFNGTIKPPSWSKAPYELDPQNPSNNAFLNEPFIVWMRVAAFPTFRKPYSRIDMALNPSLDKGLEAGQYRLTINYRYPVLYYQSKKFFVLSTTSIFGSKNLMLGVVYMVMGFLLLLLASAFAFIARKDGNCWIAGLLQT